MDNKLLITDADAGQRLDKYLFRRFNNAPKSFVYKMLRKKRVKLNGGRAEGGEALRAGDELTVYIAPETQAALYSPKAAAEAPAPAVVYEDGHILVCGKPAGQLTHGGGGDLTSGVTAYLAAGGAYDPAAKGFAPAPVHRLDRNTSGAVVFAKTLRAAQTLAGLKGAEKFYTAVAAGRAAAPLALYGIHEKDAAANRVTIKQGGEGRAAALFAEPVRHGGGFTVLRVRLMTGRSHQIRAQLACAGYPIIGDPKYGDMAANRRFGETSQLLHAGEVRFVSVQGELAYLNGLVIAVPPPDAFARYL